VKTDYTILSKYYDVKKYKFESSKNIFKMTSEQIKLIIFLILNIWKYDLIYCWFADYHSFLPILFSKIFKKKSIIIVGGYDAVSIPELKFGVFYKENKKIRILFVKFSFRNADYILPVDKTLIEGVNYYISEKGLSLGVKYFVKNVQKEKAVLSVGSVADIRTFKRKGFDLLLEIAHKMPDVIFVIIGLNHDMLKFTKNIATDNVRLLGFVSNEKLVDYYSKVKVFCQLSLSEGLPNTLCEAMLCECIPVGSNVNGIPSAIDNCGFILKVKNVDKAVELIKKALNSGESLGKKARQRIINNYSLEKREKEITLLIKKLIN